MGTSDIRQRVIALADALTTSSIEGKSISRAQKEKEGDIFAQLQDTISDTLCKYLLCHAAKRYRQAEQHLRQAYEGIVNLKRDGSAEEKTLVLINLVGLEAMNGLTLTSILNCPLKADMPNDNALTLPGETKLESNEVLSHELAYNLFLHHLQYDRFELAESSLLRAQEILHMDFSDADLVKESLTNQSDFFKVRLALVLFELSQQRRDPLDVAKLLIGWQKDLDREIEKQAQSGHLPNKLLNWILLIRCNLLSIQALDKALQTELNEIFDKSERNLFQVEIIANSILRLDPFLSISDGKGVHSAIKIWHNAFNVRLQDFQKAQHYKSLLSNKIRRAYAQRGRRQIAASMSLPHHLRRIGSLCDSLTCKGGVPLQQKVLATQLKYIFKHISTYQTLGDELKVNLSKLSLRLYCLAIDQLGSSHFLDILTSIPIQVLAEGAMLSTIESQALSDLITTTFFGEKASNKLIEVASNWTRKLEEVLTAKYAQGMVASETLASFIDGILTPIRCISGILPRSEEYGHRYPVYDRCTLEELKEFNEEQSMALDTEIFMIDAEDLEKTCDWSTLADRRVDRLKLKQSKKPIKTRRRKLSKTRRERIKNFRDDFTPDPERWIPLKQRSYYVAAKAKALKKPQKMPEASGLGVQGGAVDASLELQVAPSKAADVTASASHTRGSQKKGKKRGGKRH